MKNVLFITLLLGILTIPASAEAEQKKKPKKPERTILERNTDWSGKVTADAYAGEVEIRFFRDTVITRFDGKMDTVFIIPDTVIIAPRGGEACDTNIYIVWRNASGYIISYATIGGKGCDASFSICANATRDTFFVTGLFSDTAWAGDKMLVGGNGDNAFIAAFLKDGTCIWARSSSSSGDDWGKNVFVNKGHVIMTGMYDALEGEIIDFGAMQATAWKTGINYFDVIYRCSDGVQVADSKGIFSVKESKQ